ncbi:senecionine N-oxygenase-like [Mercenaria mercenaria]|uniref:senecionine N-oxygenase-like n=1 Tax=Mercenaria mercenaria TaxID=6596 RepID=UPI00234F6F2A|nr:senecionine N-oxygenase-like [Mercenaria mercenaria]
MSRPKICIIGAGPSGLSTLFHFAKMEQMPDIICYEKQSTWLGLWNLSWKTGLDENGEPVHTSVYKDLWCNAPCEAHEYYDYTVEQHFGQRTPSFLSRIVMRDYLEGRFTRGAPRGRNLKEFIQFNTAVRYVKYRDEKDEFTVTINDYNSGQTRDETFSHVIVANGIFNTPNLPEFPGMNEFKGRILHSHDFRDARQFRGQRVLIVGAGLTGEDLVLQLLKFGAERVILAYRTRPKGDTCKMPDGVEEKPIVERFDHYAAHFKDGSSAEIDAVILTTGYRNYFPFLEDRFRISEETHPYPEGLYNACLFYKAGNNRLFYVGVLEPFHTILFLDVMACWTCKYIMGQLPDEPKEQNEMDADCHRWIDQVNAIVSELDFLRFQTALISHLAELTGYNNDVAKREAVLQQLLKDRKGSLGLAGFKDRCFTSIYSGTVAPKQTPFMQNFDDSIETFLQFK